MDDDNDGRGRDPTGVRTALRIVRKALAVARGERRRLLPVLVGIFLLDLALAALLVNLASAEANLDAMRPFYEIEDNSTASAAASNEESPLWELHITGKLFWDLSTVIAIFSFSKVYRLHDVNNNVHRGRRLWRECQSLALVMIVWEVVSYFVLSTLHVNGMEDLFRKFDAIFDSGPLLTAVVVTQEEGVHGFSAIERAWGLVCQKLKEVSVIGAMFLFTRAVLYQVYLVVASVSLKEGPPAIGDQDTAADIFRFSLVATLPNVILQLFTCSVILVIYMESNRHRIRRRDTAEGSDISENQESQIKKIKRLTRLLMTHDASNDTVQMLARELLKHCDRALQHVRE